MSFDPRIEEYARYHPRLQWMHGDHPEFFESLFQFVTPYYNNHFLELIEALAISEPYNPDEEDTAWHRATRCRIYKSWWTANKPEWQAFIQSIPAGYKVVDVLNLAIYALAWINGPPSFAYPGVILPSPTSILPHLLAKIQLHNADRYSAWFNDPSKEILLRSILLPEIEALFSQNRPFTMQEFIALRSPRIPHAAGVYIHLIRSDLDRLYTGQACNLALRIINQHNSLTYRKNNPCLHYYAMESMKAGCWVLAGTIPPEKIDDLTLNIFEFWIACSFQTLQPHQLDKYLPQQAPRVSPHHLNVESPLHQGAKGFGPAEWIALTKFNDPLIYGYYIKGCQRGGYKTADIRNQRTLMKVHRGSFWDYHTLKDGRIRLSVYNLYFTISDPTFNPPVSGIKLDFQLCNDKEENPNRYALSATADDPAYRLSIRAYPDIIDSEGNTNSPRYLTTRGEKFLFRANTFVDWMELKPADEIQQTPRRYVWDAEQKCYYYTSDVQE